MTRIIDSTLREGMQTAGGRFTVGQSVETARLLVRLGVDTIECGHPSISDDECARVAAVVAAVGDVPVLAHARAQRTDIDAVAKSGAGWVGIFLGVNDISRASRLPGRSLASLYQQIDDTVRYARGLGLSVRFTVEDSSRTDAGELGEAYLVAVEAGAERACFADTVGILEPSEVHERVTRLRRLCPRVDLEVHFHDDRGLALANSLAAVDAGAEWVSTSVNGLGERAGVVDLALLAVNLHQRGGRPLIGGDLLPEISRRVGAYSRSMPDARRPVVGRDAFRHVAKLHRAAVQRDSRSYEWIDPGLVGRERTSSERQLPEEPQQWIVDPKVISATELRHHRAGPGERFVLVDERFVPGAAQYCIARHIPELDDYGAGHVDTHVHHCDSLFAFLGSRDGYEGLTVEVTLGSQVFQVHSPSSVFIPAGVPHGYRVIGGSGTYLNHVLAGDYNSSLLDPLGSTS
ncbi:2-isopropylmalate synthase [Mangrovihabitans endophyticus]|uniref:2-isopropylmalate synthase n=1 Tax=Mangrovihabitans endophyticus TaxID=1751298 RepID=A0A8J3FMU2_9ACTN|nr:2-isopropylmalate synthase [Mangrovihabitans endophyticus]GGK78900.1 2-isopropylmalate synthase [Mangrovihabitans endophyticus]